jgi:hypothetical protein
MNADSEMFLSQINSFRSILCISHYLRNLNWVLRCGGAVFGVPPEDFFVVT